MPQLPCKQPVGISTPARPATCSRPGAHSQPGQSTACHHSEVWHHSWRPPQSPHPTTCATECCPVECIRSAAALTNRRMHQECMQEYRSCSLPGNAGAARAAAGYVQCVTLPTPACSGCAEDRCSGRSCACRCNFAAEYYALCVQHCWACRTSSRSSPGDASTMASSAVKYTITLGLCDKQRTLCCWRCSADSCMTPHLGADSCHCGELRRPEATARASSASGMWSG
jgi:hypothetical protein